MFENSVQKGTVDARAATPDAGQPDLSVVGDPDKKSKPVYTMPRQFMPKAGPTSGGNKPGGSKLKTWLIIGGIGVVVLIVVLAVIVLVMQSIASQQVVETPAPLTTQTTEEEPVVNQDIAEPVNSQLTLNLNVDDSLEESINEELFPNGVNSNANTNTSTTNSAVAGAFPDKSDVTIARDKDKDKLTDEEEDLYGTRFDLPDTDKDGFVDGTELLNLFSPTEADETLINSGLTIEYTSDKYDWSIQYPSSWVAEALDATEREVLFTSDTEEGEFVEVLITENTQGVSAAEWFASLYDDIEPADLESARVGTLKGIVSPDGYTYYLADDEVIIGILYNFGNKEEIHFATTFQMMVNSFQYTLKNGDKKNDDTNANSNNTANANGGGSVNANSNANTSRNGNVNNDVDPNANSRTIQ
jgi:hypothetical protein